MPTAAETAGNSRAISTARKLVGAVVPMVTIRATPAALARATTAARSTSNAISSRWACVSMSCMLLRHSGVRRCKRAEPCHVLLLGSNQPVEHVHDFRIVGTGGTRLLRLGDQLGLVGHELS